MTERTTPFRDVKGDASQSLDSTIDSVRSEIDRLVGGLDLQQVTRKVQDFGRENPVALALAALTVGIAAGMLVRKSVSGSEYSASTTQ